LVEETGENHQPVSSYWQTLCQNALVSLKECIKIVWEIWATLTSTSLAKYPLFTQKTHSWTVKIIMSEYMFNPFLFLSLKRKKQHDFNFSFKQQKNKSFH
jgi:hypothetical protein